MAVYLSRFAGGNGSQFLAMISMECEKRIVFAGEILDFRRNTQ